MRDAAPRGDVAPTPNRETPAVNQHPPVVEAAAGGMLSLLGMKLTEKGLDLTGLAAFVGALAMLLSAARGVAQEVRAWRERP